MADSDAPTGRDRPTDTDQLQRAIADGLDTLPCLTRAVFLHHCIDDLRYAEIAWRCGIGVDEVMLRMTDALTGVRRYSDGDPTCIARMRRAVRPWRLAWMGWRRAKQDRRLGI